MGATFITLPGIGGSGEQHWQSKWERDDASFKRFEPESWDQPELENWVASVDRAVASAVDRPILVAHSLACLLVAHWAARSSAGRVAGAFLVSVPDPTGAKFPAAASSFRAAPTVSLPFPALIIASTNDPYGTIEYSRRRATEWNASIIELGPLGHINAASNLGDWAQGRALLEAFSAGLRSRH